MTNLQDKKLDDSSNEEQTSSAQSTESERQSTGLVTRERLRELAFDISTANGLLRVLLSHGRSVAVYEGDFQNAVGAFDAALDGLYEALRCSKCGDCLYDEMLTEGLI